MISIRFLRLNSSRSSRSNWMYRICTRRRASCLVPVLYVVKKDTFVLDSVDRVGRAGAYFLSLAQGRPSLGESNGGASESESAVHSGRICLAEVFENSACFAASDIFARANACDQRGGRPAAQPQSVPQLAFAAHQRCRKCRTRSDYSGHKKYQLQRNFLSGAARDRTRNSDRARGGAGGATAGPRQRPAEDRSAYCPRARVRSAGMVWIRGFV